MLVCGWLTARSRDFYYKLKAAFNQPKTKEEVENVKKMELGHCALRSIVFLVFAPFKGKYLRFKFKIIRSYFTFIGYRKTNFGKISDFCSCAYKLYKCH